MTVCLLLDTERVLNCSHENYNDKNATEIQSKASKTEVRSQDNERKKLHQKDDTNKGEDTSDLAQRTMCRIYQDNHSIKKHRGKSVIAYSWGHQSDRNTTERICL
jgi:hypothetical protein